MIDSFAFHTALELKIDSVANASSLHCRNSIPVWLPINLYKPLQYYYACSESLGDATPPVAVTERLKAYSANHSIKSYLRQLRPKKKKIKAKTIAASQKAFKQVRMQLFLEIDE